MPTKGARSPLAAAKTLTWIGKEPVRSWTLELDLRTCALRTVLVRVRVEGLPCARRLVPPGRLGRGLLLLAGGPLLRRRAQRLVIAGGSRASRNAGERLRLRAPILLLLTRPAWRGHRVRVGAIGC